MKNSKKNESEKTWYLDPDFRPLPPKDKPYCCRCQKAIKGKSIKVTVNWETWEVKRDENGQELIGLSCWKIITQKSN